MRVTITTHPQAPHNVPQESESSPKRRKWGWAFVPLLLFSAFAAYGAYESPWLLWRTLWFVMRLPTPPASAHLPLRIYNETNETLLATVQNVNDVSCRTSSPWLERQHLRMGYRRSAECLLEPGAEAFVSLPSESDPRMAFLLVTVRTQMESPLRQRVGLFLISWPWEDGEWKWRDPSSTTGWPEMVLHIEAQDLTSLDLEEIATHPGDSLGAKDIKLIRK